MRLAAAVLTVAVLTACAAPPSAEPPTGVVFFDAAEGITVADVGGAVLSTDATVANPDWSRLYAVRGPQLVTFDPTTNRELATVAVPAGRTARVVSTSGRSVALTEHRTAHPEPRQRTRIVVADPAGARPARTLDLAGNFDPEAFSTDDAYLFVLEYLPAHAPERYRVRRVEVATGAVEPLLLRDKSLVPPGAEEEMRGEGRQAVLSPDRDRLYTLYLHQGDHEHTRDLLAGGSGRTVHAFVHVLSLTEGWAYCLDLPDPFGAHPADTHALTISPDGRTLYVGELTTKHLAVADTETLTVSRVATLSDPDPGGPHTAMTTSADGGELYVGSAKLVRRLDSRTLEVTATWPVPAPVQGLAVGPDGLLVGQADRITRLDTTTGDVIDTVAAPGLRMLRTNTSR